MGDMADYYIDQYLSRCLDFGYRGEAMGDERELLAIGATRAETPMAWLIVYRDGGRWKEAWFPKSECYIENDVLVMPRWLYTAANDRAAPTYDPNKLLDNFDD